MVPDLDRRRVILLLAAIPAACKTYWTDHFLTPVIGRVWVGSPATVAILPVHLPPFLLRTELVRSSESSQPDILPWDWWGQPLAVQIGQVTVQNLTQRLNGGIVYADTGAVTVQPAAEVEITIIRFDLNQTGSLLLQAQLAVSGRTTQSRNVLYSVTPANSSADALVYAMSVALGQMADIIAVLLTETQPRPVYTN